MTPDLPNPANSQPNEWASMSIEQKAEWARRWWLSHCRLPPKEADQKTQEFQRSLRGLAKTDPPTPPVRVTERQGSEHKTPRPISRREFLERAIEVDCHCRQCERYRAELEKMT
jgi:hypothetical protein